MTPPVAVVDLGTISTRLLVTDGTASTRIEEVTRMGADVRLTSRIGSEGLAAVEEALDRFADEITARGVDAVRVVGTEAARRATNREEIGRLVGAKLGADLEIIDAAEEGAAAFAGALAGLGPGHDDRGVVLVVDIGGGSTEFAIGTRDGLEHVHSIPIGASTVTDAYLRDDPPAPSELSAALSVIELHLDDVRREVPGLADALSSSGRIVGLGGTFTTMAAVEIGLIDDDPSRIHGFVLDRPAAEDVFRTLATESADDRRHNPGLGPERVDLIVGGSCLVVETMRQFDIDEITISVTDLLDGIAMEMLA